MLMDYEGEKTGNKKSRQVYLRDARYNTCRF